MNNVGQLISVIYRYELKIPSTKYETQKSFPIFFSEVKALIKNKAFGFLRDERNIAEAVPKDLPQTKICSSLTLNFVLIQS